MEPNVLSNAIQSQQVEEPQVQLSTINSNLVESNEKSKAPVDLQIKLERSRAAIRTLSRDIGAVIVTSSSDASEEDFTSQSDEIEQVDNQFAKNFKYTTNVSV